MQLADRRTATGEPHAEGGAHAVEWAVSVQFGDQAPLPIGSPARHRPGCGHRSGDRRGSVPAPESAAIQAVQIVPQMGAPGVNRGFRRAPCRSSNERAPRIPSATCCQGCGFQPSSLSTPQEPDSMLTKFADESSAYGPGSRS